MAPSRKVNNGRSPLVNKQHQITAFFNKSTSPLQKPTPTQNPEKTQFEKPQNPNPNFSDSPNSSPPATPSPFNAKSKPKSIIKPPLVIGSLSQKPSISSKDLYADEVVGRRIRVYWPLDTAWYEGTVKAFDTVSRKHLVEYDDGEEELIDLTKEKIEWIEGGDEGDGDGELGFSGTRVKRRRLRKASIVVDDDDDEKAGEGNVGPVECDLSDEDWVKNGGGVEEDEEEVGCLKRKKRESGGSETKKKRKDDDDGVVHSSHEKKKIGVVLGSKVEKPALNVQGNYRDVNCYVSM